MRTLAHLILFKALYAAAVGGAANGLPWAGPLALGPFLVLHLWLTPAELRRQELAFALGIGAVGLALDSVLFALGATGYAGVPAGWPVLLVPPWIVALWVAFATLPGIMRWLHGRPLLAVLFGAIAGPLSFWFGERLGAVIRPDPVFTSVALSIEYAVLMPLMVRFAPGYSSASAMSASMLRTNSAPSTTAR